MENMPINKKGLLTLFLGFCIILLGYFLMSGGQSDNPNVFSYEIFNFTRITLAPIIIVFGLIVEVFAIMYNFKDKK